MNHRKVLDEKEYDDEADYMFVVAKKRSAFMKQQLEELHLKVIEFPSLLNPDRVILVIFFSDLVLDLMAENIQIPMRLLDYS